MHLRDTANHARDIPLYYLQLIGLHIVARLAACQQRVGIKGEPLRNGLLLGRSRRFIAVTTRSLLKVLILLTVS